MVGERVPRHGRCACMRSKRPSCGQPRNEETAERAGQIAIEGAQAAALQRLQDSADAQPGEAGHSRSGRSDSMDFLTWGRNPWGECDPHARLVGPVLGVARSPAWCSSSAHASYMLLSAHRKRPAAETDALEAARLPTCPTRIERHSLAARLFHWVMAAAMFVLLFTAFLPWPACSSRGSRGTGSRGSC